ncbi:MAG TPA: thiamine phosphate synthase [Burkholderiales bacterium]|jgi:thiamine-phosphate pyrophosphorylase|nr:thiamine phosphate synthase [Burkholderiales bacterium]
MNANPLPDRYLITPEPACANELAAFMTRLAQALSSGVRLVQLRAKRLSPEAYVCLAADALRLCREHGARLILNPPAAARLVGLAGIEADGIHLSSVRLITCRARPVGPDRLLSAACHNREQLLHADRIGADLVTLSPVLPTASHPEATPLGWEGFAELVRAAQVPVYALGGMETQHLPRAKEAGAQGIAAIRGLW